MRGMPPAAGVAATMLLVPGPGVARAALLARLPGAGASTRGEPAHRSVRLVDGHDGMTGHAGMELACISKALGRRNCDHPT